MFARLNYSYQDIYLLDASLRIDGSSEFGSDKRYAPFLFRRFGIEYSQVRFMEKYDFVNHLKVRGSFGQTGKVNFAPYAAVPTTRLILMNGIFPVRQSSFDDNPRNRDLKWEKTNKFDVGFELGLLKNLLILNFHGTMKSRTV